MRWKNPSISLFITSALLWAFLQAAFPEPVEGAKSGKIIGWGDNWFGQYNVPSPNSGFVAIAAGGWHSIGLKADGSIVAWGYNEYGQCNVPSPNTGFVAVAGGIVHSLGLKANGSIVAWGNNFSGQCKVPKPNTGFVAVAAGGWHNLGLKADGSIVAWGLNSDGQCDIPSPNTGFVAVSAGAFHSLGLKANGSIVARGSYLYGQCNVPSPNSGFVAVAAGEEHSLGIKANSSIVAWGYNDYGQCNIPSPNTGFVAVAGGFVHSLGLKADGYIVAWGWNDYGQCNIPSPNSGFVAVAAGEFHSLGIKEIKYSGGSGTESDPWQISCPNDLLYLSAHTEDYNSHFILTADIDLSGYTFTTALIAPDTDNSDWEFEGTTFTGSFNGNGHKIRNLTIDTNNVVNDYLGLFGQTGPACQIKNLGIEDVNIIGSDDSLVLGGLVGENYGTINNCFATGAVTDGNNSNCLGGLIGANNNGSITCSYAAGTFTGGDDSIGLGGLVGGNSGNIKNCYSKGSVTSGNFSIGLGGLVGVAFASKVTNCYSTCLVKSGNDSEYLGGFSGDNYDVISNCFWDTQTSGLQVGCGNNSGSIINLLGKSTIEMQIQETFTGSPTFWDFVGETQNGTQDYWRMPCQTGYPLLSWQTCFSYSDGCGTEYDPWQIACPNDLLYLADHPADYNSCFILTADIDLSDYIFTTAVIAPDTNNIADVFQGTAFTGKFNGNGHKIRNLTIDTNNVVNDYLGLFGQTGPSCKIKNLGIEDCNITACMNSWAIGGLVGSNYGSISNCFSTGAVTGRDNSFSIGGLIGFNGDAGSINNCHSTTAVTGGDGSSYLGGLVGVNSSESTISNCFSTGAVTGGDYSVSISGLVGVNWYGTVSSCFATGPVTSGNNSEYLGGLVGNNYFGSINNCYATDSINCGDNSQWLGGLVGTNYGNITNSYAAGQLPDTMYAGGFAGEHYGCIGNSFWNIETCGTTFGVASIRGPIENLFVITTAQMKTQSTFTDYGWDFVGETENGTEDYWKIRNGYTFPRLSWQMDTPGDFLGSYSVNLADLAVFANAWLSKPIDANWNPLCDLHPDNIIDTLDLQIFVANWLKE